MPWAAIGINSEETTIAEVLKAKGYHTGIIGKCILDIIRNSSLSSMDLMNIMEFHIQTTCGLSIFDGIPIHLKDTTSINMKYPVLPLIEGNEKSGEVKTLTDQNKLTTDYTEHALKFIENHKNEKFFLYLPHSMVHIPLGVSGKFRYKSKQGMYGDVMMEVDWSIGEIMKALERYGLEKNTLVIFTVTMGHGLISEIMPELPEGCVRKRDKLGGRPADSLYHEMARGNSWR